MSKFLKFLNDNHWYIIAGIIIFGIVFWTHGCESQVTSLINTDKKVNRAELQVEIEYVAGIAKTRVMDLDKKDEIRQTLFDALVLVSQGGQINTLGIVNLLATIGAVSWGLNRNQAVKAAAAKISTNTS